MDKIFRELTTLISLLLLALNSDAIVITQVGISPQPAFTSAPLKCYAKAVSVQSNYSNITFTWYLNNEALKKWDTSVNAANNTQVYSDLPIPTEEVRKGDVWLCSAYANDGFYSSGWVNSSSAFINKGCGILTEDEVLTANINSNTTCFTVNASNMVLDCNGHSITGFDEDGSYGVYLESKRNVTIKNCIIEHYDTALLLNSSYANSIYRNTLSYNKIGVSLKLSANNTLRENIANWNSQNGMFMDSSDGNLLGNSSFKNNNESGIFLDNSKYNSIENSEISSNLLYGIVLSSNSNNLLNNKISGNKRYGVYLASAFNNTLSQNTISNNSPAGIFLYLSDNNTLSGNRITSNDGGILLESSQKNLMRGNNITYNSIGLILNSSQSNILVTNTLIDNKILGVNLISSDKNEINENEINSSSFGIYALSSSSNSISRNRINLNNVGIYLNTLSNENSITLNSLELNLIGINFGVSYKNTIVDSIINSKNQDIHSEFNSNNAVINSSFSISKVYNDETSSITTEWYLTIRALVNDKPTGGVWIDIIDVNSTNAGSKVTDQNGIAMQEVAEFTIKNSSLIAHNPYKITATYVNSTTYIYANVTNSKTEEIKLTVREEEKIQTKIESKTDMLPGLDATQLTLLIIAIVIVNLILVFFVFRPFLFRKKKEEGEFE
jgi:parallel beta-helix repeat protein